MISLVLKMSISLDGYVGSPDGGSEWVRAGSGDDALDWTVETVGNAGAHLMGATTYGVMAGHWPNDTGPFAKPMNTLPKIVFSNSLTSADWDDTTVVRGDLADAVRASSRSATTATCSPTAGRGSPGRWSRPV